MAYELRNNSGSLFKNDYKKTDSQPDYTGNGMFEGVEGKLSGWLKNSARGKFLSIAFTPSSELGERSPAPTKPPLTKAAAAKTINLEEVLDEIDDEIPF
jgi:hypothetical protein